MGERRDSKKRETRERISDAATALFFERDFDAVTLDEIAAAAAVSKVTVLNYFDRKEDLMLDREDDLRLRPLREALRARDHTGTVGDVVRRAIERLRKENHTITRVDPLVLAWWRVVRASPALLARLHEHADAAVDDLAVEIASPSNRAVARLMAGTIVLTVRTAREEALCVLERGDDERKAAAMFKAIVARGCDALDALEEE